MLWIGRLGITCRSCRRSKKSVENQILLSTLALIYTIVALVCLLWPEQLQQIAIQRSGTQGKYRAVLNLIRSPRYLLFLQFIGALSASAAVALLLFLLRNMRYGS
jgi:protein-S-isoprenylcysteine O-methyltransferase Ste14